MSSFAEDILKHTLAKGETLYSISRKYNVSYEALAAANGITDPTKLRIGTVLIIPEVHVVTKGETLFGISRQYGIAVNELLSANKLKSDYVLKIDDVLIIPGVKTNVSSAVPPLTVPSTTIAPPLPHQRRAPPLLFRQRSLLFRFQSLQPFPPSAAAAAKTSTTTLACKRQAGAAKYQPVDEHLGANARTREDSGQSGRHEARVACARQSHVSGWKARGNHDPSKTRRDFQDHRLWHRRIGRPIERVQSSGLHPGQIRLCLCIWRKRKPFRQRRGNKCPPARKSAKLALTRKTALLSLISSFSGTVSPSTQRSRLGIER